MQVLLKCSLTNDRILHLLFFIKCPQNLVWYIHLLLFHLPSDVYLLKHLSHFVCPNYWEETNILEHDLFVFVLLLLSIFIYSSLRIVFYCLFDGLIMLQILLHLMSLSYWMDASLFLTFEVGEELSIFMKQNFRLFLKHLLLLILKLKGDCLSYLSVNH
jgi:hypothetical protein